MFLVNKVIQYLAMDLEVKTDGIVEVPFPMLPNDELRRRVAEEHGPEVAANISPAMAEDYRLQDQYYQCRDAVLGAMASGRIPAGRGHEIIAKSLYPLYRDTRPVDDGK